MRLEPLYRVRFSYPEAWFVELDGERGKESQHFFIAEGRCEGGISGRLRGANHPRRRTDLTYVPDFQGVIETDEGAKVMFDYPATGAPTRRTAVQLSAPAHTSPATSPIAV